MKLTPREPTPEIHNPWRQSLENCISGDNYLRAQEYRDLIEELDDLYRLRAMHDAAPSAEPVADEPVAWMIECTKGFTGWWCGHVRGGIIDCRFFDKDPNRAVVFPSKESAEAVIQKIGHSCMRATSHQWMLPSTRPAAAPADRAQQLELPPDLSLEQLDEKLAAWSHLNLYGYVDARPKGGGARLESFTDEQIVKAVEDAGHNLVYRNYKQYIECGRAVIAAYRAQTVPTPAQLPKKPPFIGGAQEGLPERQWLMSLKDLEEYLAQHGAQRK